MSQGKRKALVEDEHMINAALAAKNGPMKRRVTIKQIAQEAGLSVATVDRVISGRRSVRRATATRVQSAAEALGYQPGVPIHGSLGLEPIKCAVLLQKKTTLFYQNLAEELIQASQSAADPAVELTVEFMEDYLEASKVAEHVHSTGEGADLLAVVATDSPYISEAIDALAARHIPVVALLSDLSAPNLAGYVGINDRIAGRTAAWAIARCARQPGSIGILIGSHGYLGQKTGRSDFEAIFARKRPSLRFLSLLSAATILMSPIKRRSRSSEVLRSWWVFTASGAVSQGRFEPLRKADFRRSQLMYVTCLRRPRAAASSEERLTLFLLLICLSLRARPSKCSSSSSTQRT
jgi:hypothetical protein